MAWLGWYATTLNYVWPLALGLYGLSYIIQIISNEKISIAQQISYVVASLYAINQEQMCALFVGFYALFMIYSLVNIKGTYFNVCSFSVIVYNVRISCIMSWK